MKNKTIFQILLVVVLVVVGGTGFMLLSSSNKQSQKRAGKPEARIVNVEDVKFGDMNVKVEGNGVVESQRTLDIVSEVTAKVVYAKNDLKNGTYAAKGEVVIELDKREAENNLFSLRSDFINGVASVLPELKVENQVIYDKWHEYFTTLDFEGDIPALPEVTNSYEKIRLSSKKIFSKYFAVKNQEITLSRHTIKAPFDGYIKSNGILKDSYISRGQQLFTISDAVNLEIAVPLIKQEYSLLDFAGSPKVKIYPNDNASEMLVGKVIRKDTKLDRNSQSLNVYVVFRNGAMKASFLPGNYVYVEIEGKRFKDVALVPRYLIGNDNDVYTMNDSVLGKLNVEILASQGDNAVVAKTIPENTKLVTTILQKPLIGMPIQTPEMAEAAAAAAKALEEAQADSASVDGTTVAVK